MASTGKSQYLRPDPSVTSAAAADAFGGGEGNAELLIAANQARWSEHLEAANLSAIDRDATEALDVDAVEEAAGVEFVEQTDGKKAVAVRGHYVVGVYEDSTGRLDKIVLHYDRDDGSVELAEVAETPELAALRAKVAAASEIEDAKRQAERIVAEAREKAARIAQEAEAEAAKAVASESEPEPDPDADSGDAGAVIDVKSARKPQLEAEAKRRGVYDKIKGTGANKTITAEDLRKALA